MRNTTIKIVLLLGLVFVPFFTVQAGALRAISIAKVRKNTTTGGVSATVRYRGSASNDPSFTSSANDPIYNAVVDIGKASLGSVVKKRAFSPWGAALTVAITAAGYVIDSNTGEITAPGSSAPDLSGYCIWGNPNVPTPTTFGDCFTQITSNYTNYPVVVGPSVYSSFFNGYVITFGYQSPSGYIDQGSLWVSPTDPGQLTTPGQPQTLDNPSIWDAVEPGLDSPAVRDLLHDPETGLPEPLPEITSKGNEISDRIIRAHDIDPNNDPAPDQVPQPRSTDEVAIRQRDENQPDYSFNSQDPTFDSTLEIPEKVNLSDELSKPNRLQKITDFTDGIKIQATAGNCSINIPVSIGGHGGSGEINFCQFSDAISGLGVIILGLAYVTAGMIIIGIKV